MTRQVIMVNNSVINIVRAPQEQRAVQTRPVQRQTEVVQYAQPVQGNHPLVPVLNVVQAVNTFNTTVRNAQSVLPILTKVVSLFR